MTDYTRRLERLEAEAAENDRFEREGPRLTFEQVHRQASERAVQRIMDGEPESTDEELAARRDELSERFRGKRGR